jgi:hypothetical protein
MEPNYSIMSLVDLKQVAKTRHIKQYYIMKRHQLIHLLSMDELPSSFKIEKLTIHQLREEAKQKGIRGFWTLRRDQLVELLYPTNNKDDNSSKNSYQDTNDSQDIRV